MEVQVLFFSWSEQEVPGHLRTKGPQLVRRVPEDIEMASSGVLDSLDGVQVQVCHCSGKLNAVARQQTPASDFDGKLWDKLSSVNLGQMLKNSAWV